MDRGQTGGERPKGEEDMHDIEAECLVPASRIIDLPGITGICDDPAKPGDFGDVTALESENKNKINFLP